MKDKIIDECKKYGYELIWNGNSILSFCNYYVREELKFFDVYFDYDLECVSMAIIMDSGSWSYATECSLHDEESIMNNIYLWISKENLKEVEKYFLESEEVL